MKLRFLSQWASGGRRRWLLIGFFSLAGLILVPLACLELAYRIELSRITERPPTPIEPLPPLVMRVAALGLLPSSEPETHPIYPWTAVAAVARLAWRMGPTRSGGHALRFASAMSASQLAARNLLSSSGKWRGHFQWVFANWALSTWISRHLTGEEALSTAVETMSFGPGTHGLRDGAQRLFGKRVEQLDAEEVARLMVLSLRSGLSRQPDKWRAARDHLLQRMRLNGIIDDATLLEATARALSPDPPRGGAVEASRDWRSPTRVELNEDWRQRSATRFAVARGDFDGDGKPDEARLVVSRDGKRLALVVALSGSSERLISQWDGDVTRTGIATLPAGRYRTACGKGYFECEPQEPEELVMQWDGIDLFYEESADSVYYMPERAGEFLHVRLSD